MCVCRFSEEDGNVRWKSSEALLHLAFMMFWIPRRWLREFYG